MFVCKIEHWASILLGFAIDTCHLRSRNNFVKKILRSKKFFNLAKSCKKLQLVVKVCCQTQKCEKYGDVTAAKCKKILWNFKIPKIVSIKTVTIWCNNSILVIVAIKKSSGVERHFLMIWQNKQVYFGGPFDDATR